MEDKEQQGFEFAQAAAEEMGAGETMEAVGEAFEKAEKNRGKIAGFFDDISTLIRMVRAYWSGSYTDIPWTVLIGISGGIFYFLNPVDAIPDMIPGVGYIDDASVIAFVLATFSQHINAFRNWERSQMEALPEAVVVE